MVRCSNNIVGFLNVFVLLLSVPMLVTGIYLSRNGTTQCERFLDKPIIALGVLLMVLSIAGVVGSFCKVTWLLWSYLFVMFFIIVIFLCFTIFAFVVTSKGSGETIPGKAYKEYRLGAYSDWLQKRVNDAKHWNNIKSCISSGGFCTYLEAVTGRVPVSAFNKLKLNSLESGCCKPSNDCNFIYVSPTNWNKTTTNWNKITGRHKNSDCKLWDNDTKKLCYDCQACKAGFVDNLQGWWKIVAIGNIVFLIILIVFYVIGCRALINNNREYAYARSNA